MKISARNILPGKIVEYSEGPSTTRVKIEIAAGLSVTALITTEAAKDLGLKVGANASAVIKASDVMVGVD